MVRVIHTTPSAQDIKLSHLRSSTASIYNAVKLFLNGGLFYTDTDVKSSTNPGPIVEDKVIFLI